MRRFELPEDVRDRQHAFRSFLSEVVRPHLGRDDEGPLTRVEVGDWISRLVPSGIMHASLPREVGGTDRTYLERVVLAEEFAAAWPSLAVTVDSHNIVAELIARQGEDWMRSRYVPGAITGETIMGDMMSEPGAGSDTRNLQTTAVLNGDEYVVNGTKMWTTNGPWAEVALLTAVVDVEAYRQRPSRGVIHLLLDREVSSWEVRDLPLVGLRAGTTGLSEFRETRVPATHLFHAADQGYAQNLIVRGWARVLLASWAVGLMQAALDDVLAYARQRETFGRPIAGHQLIQNLISDMLIDLESSRLLTYRAAELMDSGTRCDTEQALAKLHACEAAQRVTSKAIQVLGARGLTTSEGFRTELLYRDARFLTIAEGTSEIMRLIIGRNVTGISAIA